MFAKLRFPTLLTPVVGLSALLIAAGCGSSASKSSSSSAAPATTPAASPATTAASGSPAASFSVANVGGLGMIVVDGRGEPVYVLTVDGKTNLPCTDASGCTKYWPDLPLPDGTSAATAGPGIDASKLASMKESDGETYPTYNGWLMYEFAKDNGSAQAKGQGVKSFGGTWWVLSASGTPITTIVAASTPTTVASGSGY